MDVSLTILARNAADHAGLDEGVVCAVIEQESDWNPAAVRFEPAFYQKYIVPLNLADSTEARCRATSWGLMQIMGETARERGYTGELPDLLKPELGLQWGCVALARLVKMKNGDIYAALMAWNGGANVLYAGQVIARIDKYTVPPDISMIES